ncbi:MAG: hypothetical protein ACK4N5_07715 [Myxococcales bacterium]
MTRRRQNVETALTKAIEVAIGSRRDARVWRNNVGAARTKSGFIRFGVVGQADLSGILLGGRRLELEVKTDSGSQSPSQKAFGEMIARFGGVYAVVRSVDEAVAVVDQALEEEGRRGQPGE